ncbi:MAG: DUF6531 domain-containing protein, partial [Burkholderiaceae bacterium]
MAVNRFLHTLVQVLLLMMVTCSLQAYAQISGVVGWHLVSEDSIYGISRNMYFGNAQANCDAIYPGVKAAPIPGVQNITGIIYEPYNSVATWGTCNDNYYNGPLISIALLVCNSNQRFFIDTNQCINVTSAPNIPGGPKNNGPSCPQPECGKPINPGSGNMWHTEHDYVSTVPSSALAITRTYNSSPYNWDASIVRSFGTRWTNPYDAVLKQELPYQPGTIPGTCWSRNDTQYVWCEYLPPTTTAAIPDAISILRGDGKKYLFNRNGNAWVNDTNVNDRITATFNANNTAILGWTYVSAQGDSTEAYDSNGRLITITARSGTAQRLTYSNGSTNDSSVGRMPV